jgi:hypothetical protein
MENIMNHWKAGLVCCLGAFLIALSPLLPQAAEPGPVCQGAPGEQPEFPQNTPQGASAPTDNIPNRSFIDSRYGSVGDIKFLDPIPNQQELDGTLGGVNLDPTGIFQTYNSQAFRGGAQGPGNTEAPNVYTALNVNAMFNNNMWRDGQQFGDFARRTIHMVGAHFYAGASVVSGSNLTRAQPGHPERNKFDKKYVIGSVSHAMGLQGSSAFDEMAAIGASNHGTTNFSHDAPFIAFPEGSPDGGGILTYDGGFSFPVEPKLRNHWSSVQGTESDAWVGRRINTIEAFQDIEPNVDVIGLENGYHEDDYWDPVAVNLHRMAGSGNFIWIDNKKDGNLSSIALGAENPTPPFESGFINRAVSVEGGVFSFVENSWINVNEARGVSMGIHTLGGPFQTTPGYFALDERCGSKIRSWVGFEVRPPLYDVQTNVKVDNYIGMYIADQTPELMGGNPILSPTLVDAGASPTVYTSASLIAASHAAIGDGRTGPNDPWDQDIILLNGVTIFASHVNPPKPNPNVPDAEIAGATYFDLTRNCLRVAVPMLRNVGQANEQKALIWRDLPFTDFKAGDAESNLVRSDPSLANVNLANVGPNLLNQANDGAKAAAVDGTSPFIRPQMEAITTNGEILSNEPVVLIFNNIPARHFAAANFKLAWQRLDGGKNGRYRLGGVPWSTIDSADYTIDSNMLQISITGVNFAAPGPHGESGEGMIVQIMATTAENYTLGTSFRISE